MDNRELERLIQNQKKERNNLQDAYLSGTIGQVDFDVQNDNIVEKHLTELEQLFQKDLKQSTTE